MKSSPSKLPGVVVIEPEVFGDDRGFFLETFNEQRYGPAGVETRLVQLNHSRSGRGTLRGLHFQHPQGQDKLVWVARGRVFDVAVDVRRGSPSFGQWTGCELSDENHYQVWIPAGFAHGFLVLSDVADFMYACSEYYAPGSEHVIAWNDPSIGIEWPEAKPVLSKKDASAPLLMEIDDLPKFAG